MIMATIRNVSVLVILSVLFISCGDNRLDVDVSDIESDLEIMRFEQDLAAYLSDTSVNDLTPIRKQYGEFFDMFTHQVLGIPQENDTMIAMNLRFFLKDPEVAEVMADVDSAFSDVKDIKKEMDSFLKHYRYYYPDKEVPKVVTYVSAFNYAVITTHETIGIGLDMFLGKDYVFYPRMGLPKYLSNRFSREYAVVSVIRGWYESDYDVRDVKKELLSQMVYQGKLLYYLDAMAPDMADTLKTGYSAEQLTWCEENEASIWAFFIENKLLFNTSPSEYLKYINEGPTTSGFPKESPGKVGAWIGYRIVQQYMKKNPDITLVDLLNEKDANAILEKSGYKPQK